MNIKQYNFKIPQKRTYNGKIVTTMNSFASI